MKIWQGIFFGMVLCAGSSYAEECSDIAFEENECLEEDVECHRHRRAPRPTPEEEHLWGERTDASWPARRENFIDGFTR